GEREQAGQAGRTGRGEVERLQRLCTRTPLIPAKAGIQGRLLGIRDLGGTCCTTPVVEFPETSNDQSLRLLSRVERDHRCARAPLPRRSGKAGARRTAKLRRGQGDVAR